MVKRAGDRRAPGSWQPARAVAVLPEGFVVVLAAAVALGELCALLGLQPFLSAWGSRLFLLAMALVAAAAWWPFRRRRPAALPVSDFPWAPSIPGLVLVGYAVATRLLPLGKRTEWFLGGDHVRHLLFVAQERATGNLSYGDQVYPRAWHTLVASVWSSTGADLDRAGLLSLVDMLATAAWCLPAALSIATGALAVHVARRAGLSARSESTAGVLAAAMVFWPPFLSVYQALGFENSLVAAVVLAVVARQVIEPAEHKLWPPVVVLMAIVVCAHTWQLLLPALGIVLVQQAWGMVQGGLGAANVALAVIAPLAAALVAMPGLLAVVQSLGIQHATDAGVEAPLPVALLLAGLVSCGVLALRSKGDRTLSVLFVMMVMPALTAVAVALHLGIGLFVYYPSKLLWHSAALGLAPLAVLAVMGWSALGRHRVGAVARPARVLGTAAAALAVAFALITPAGAFLGAWSTVRGPEVVAAVTSPGAANTQVVWLGAFGDDTISRILLDFYRVDRTRERTPQPPLSVAEECSLLQAAAQPTVLSSASPQQVRARYACVPEVRVERASVP